MHLGHSFTTPISLYTLVLSFPNVHYDRESTDGVTWTPRNAATTASWLGVGFGNNLFVAVGANGDVMTRCVRKSFPPVRVRG